MGSAFGCHVPRWRGGDYGLNDFRRFSRKAGFPRDLRTSLSGESRTKLVGRERCSWRGVVRRVKLSTLQGMMSMKREAGTTAGVKKRVNDSHRSASEAVVLLTKSLIITILPHGATTRVRILVNRTIKARTSGTVVVTRTSLISLYSSW